MSEWTESDPGAGATASLRSLETELLSVASSLNGGLEDLRQQADDVFDGGWAGASADAAKSKMDALALKVESYASAAKGVGTAAGDYADEIAAIKNLARTAIAKRDAAYEQIQVELIEHPNSDGPEHYGPAQQARDEAIAELLKLARRREAADSAILGSVRAIVATTWNVDPEDCPSDRGWPNDATYDYSMDHPLGFSTDDYTAEELMDFFKAHPGEVFPFPVSGSSDVFEDGAVFTLEDTLVEGIDLPFEAGDVVVTTTDTSVKFTVISDEYFDGPGSTIEFSIVEVGGQYVLRKVAHATDANAFVAMGVDSGASATWQEQADNLKDVVNKYG